MESLKLSIIVPAYNVEKYLEKCLSSLCGLKIENEIIVVNDGSRDNTLYIARKFKENHIRENIRIISQENLGLSEARNTGLKLARGEYVSFIDSDDFVDTGAYERFINNAIADNVDIGIGRYKKIVENDGNLICVTEIQDYEKGEIRTGREYLEYMYRNYLYGSEVWDDVFKREFLLENEIFFKKGRIHEDEIFTMETMLKSQKVRFYGIYYYNYLQRSESIMSTKSLRNYENMEQNIKEMYDFMLNEKDGKTRRILEEEISRLYKIIIRHTEKEYKKESRRFKENYKKMSLGYKENKIRNLIFRLRKSIKKRIKI